MTHPWSRLVVINDAKTHCPLFFSDQVSFAPIFLTPFFLLSDHMPDVAVALCPKTEWHPLVLLPVPATWSTHHKRPVLSRPLRFSFHCQLGEGWRSSQTGKRKIQPKIKQTGNTTLDWTAKEECGGMSPEWHRRRVFSAGVWNFLNKEDRFSP